jgi:hypothetical protein
MVGPMSQPPHLPDSGAVEGELSDSDLLAQLTAERDEVLDALAELSSSDPQAALLCGHAGELSYRLHLLGGAADDFDLAVEGFAHAFRRVGKAGEAGEDATWSAWRIMFGHLRTLQYDADADDTDDNAGDPEHLGQAWELLTTGTRTLPSDDPDFDDVRALGRQLLAACSKARYLEQTQGNPPHDDTAALLDEALRRHTDALADVVEGSVEEGELRASLGFLHLRRCIELESVPDAAESARHYRAVLDAGHPDTDVPHLRHSLALALMLHGRVTFDRDELEAARDAYGTALTELRNAGGPMPDWVWEAQVNSAFIRVMIWSGWKDLGHGAAAEVELTRLLAEPGVEDRLPAQYLDAFGRLLYERSAERDDDAGRDRGVALVRRALSEWDPRRDGDITRTALVFAALQQARYQDDRDPRRAQDVLESASLVLTDEQSDPEMVQAMRMLDGWARFTLAEHGLLPEADGVPEGLDAQTLSATIQSLADEVWEGRSHFDFGEHEHLPGIGRDLAGRRRRIDGFEKALAMLRATEPGSAAHAQLAANMLAGLTAVDPDGTYVTAEHRRELTEAVLQRAEQDPEWRGLAHSVVGTALLREAMADTGATIDEAFAHFDLAEAAGNNGQHAAALALLRLTAQAQRGQTGGGTDDMEAAAEAWRRLREDPALSASTRATMDLQQAAFAAQGAVRRGDLAAADRYLAQLAEGHAQMSTENPSRIEILTLLENARTARDNLADGLGVPRLPPLPGRPGAAELRRQAARLPRDHRAWVLGDNGITRFGRAAEARDGAGLIEAMGLVQEAHDLSEPGGDSRLRYANCLGAGNCMLAEAQFDRVRRRERLARGIAFLEGALAEARGPEHRLYASTGLSLARAYRMRDDLHRRDRAAARRTGLDALRGHTWAALLQSGTDHAALAAAQATASALEVAGWCLKDDRPEEALQALDACRGLVLHAATTSSTVPDMLAAAGHAELAAEWQASGASAAADPGDPLSAVRGPLTVPSSLRRRVLAALTTADAPQAALLLDPPTPEEIGQALRALEKDALVYLVPASDEVAGTAVVVTSGGAVHAVPLPTLTEEAAPLKEYAPTGRRRVREPDTGPTAAGPVARAGGAAGRAQGAPEDASPAPAGDDDPSSARPAPAQHGDAPARHGDAPAPHGDDARHGGDPGRAGADPAAPGRDLGPVPGYSSASAAALAAGAPAPLRKQLDRLCGWAWYAAMRPLLEAFEMPQGRLPRLVLVPMGALGLVPWHAAWEPGGPRGRNYALQAAEISYAASARLLCQVAARPAAPHTGRALVVGNPTGDLYYAGEEADAVQRAFYPDARFLGRRTTGPVDGPGTPHEVLRWLREHGDDTGGGVLHLACHAAVAENARRSAYLSLSGGRLAAEELTEAVDPGGVGGRLGLVLLAACRSHVSGRGHNEAYSLATAFLVAGARSVIGSLWPVPDEATSVLMYVTHHFLRRHGEPPAKALRRAQLWMLNPDRELPEGLPRALADRVGRIDPHDLSAWAGFTHLGQ